MATHYRLKDVNTTNIPDAIHLGLNPMCHIFNRDDNDIPFFEAVARPHAAFSFCPTLSEAHIPGRHLNALLTAESVLGFKVDPEVIDKHTRAAFFSFSGPVAFPLNRDRIDGHLVNLQPHNIREGLHALYALVAFRNSDKAADIAHKCIEAILEFWNPETGWNIKTLECKCGLTFHKGESLPNELGRSIGPLVKYYRVTQDPLALELALILKNKLCEECFLASGEFNPAIMGTHSHSITSTMSSLAQLADLMQDKELIERVKAFYDNGLNEMRDYIGWSIENAAKIEYYQPGDLYKNPDRGEVNNSGDIVEAAIILGRHGYSKYFEDAERIIRSHILPSQLRDVSFIKDYPNPENKDDFRAPRERMKGGFGFPAPYGHEPIGMPWIRFNMDIVGGVVASFCEAYRNILTVEENACKVNMLFDYESPEIIIKSPYTHGSLDIQMKKNIPLFIRIPSWLNASQINIPNISVTPAVVGQYLKFDKLPVGQKIRVNFKLSERERILEHRTCQIRVKFRGDEVVAMDNLGADLYFFEPY